MGTPTGDDTKARLESIRRFYPLLIDALWELQHLDDITAPADSEVNQAPLEALQEEEADSEIELIPWKEIVGDQVGKSVDRMQGCFEQIQEAFKNPAISYIVFRTVGRHIKPVRFRERD